MSGRWDNVNLLDSGLWESFVEQVYGARPEDVHRALRRDRRSIEDLGALLSPVAAEHLERMAAHARQITHRRFGRTVVLYVPVYLSNACTNRCTYCGFSLEHEVARRTLTLEELQVETDRLKQVRFEHLLLLTGEDRRCAPQSYLCSAVRACHKRFSSVSVEIYPMEVQEYAELVTSGCDGVTLYQETYHRPTYEKVHPAGPKANMDARLEAPARAAKAGMRSVGIGALLGLADWRVEGMFLGVHGLHLRKQFWRTRLSIGFPRLKNDPGGGIALCAPSERDLAQMVCALRLFFPDADLVLSTRESEKFRDGMVGLGITRMSAGSKTQPGGYALGLDTAEQFAIADHRTPAQIAAMIQAKGYEPVWKDFDQGFLA